MPFSLPTARTAYSCADGLRVSFRLRGDDGVIGVSVTRNEEPAPERVNELVDARRGGGDGLARGSRGARHVLSRLGVALGLGELKPPPPGVSILTTSPASRSLVAFDGSSSPLT